MKDFDCHFRIVSTIQVNNMMNQEEAIARVANIYLDNLRYKVENALHAGVDYEEENIERLSEEEKLKKKEHYIMDLVWSGYWRISERNEKAARSRSARLLSEKLLPFVNTLQKGFIPYAGVSFGGVKSAEVEDVLELD